MLEGFSKNTEGIYDPQERQSFLFWMLHTRVSHVLGHSAEVRSSGGGEVHGGLGNKQ